MKGEPDHAFVADARCNDTMPNKPTMQLRSIRVPDALWKAAQEKAAERGENVSDVLRAALEKYVRSKS